MIINNGVSFAAGFGFASIIYFILLKMRAFKEKEK